MERKNKKGKTKKKKWEGIGKKENIKEIKGKKKKTDKDVTRMF